MFDSNRKKTFHSQALNRLTVLERLTWLIPVGFNCARNHLHTL